MNEMRIKLLERWPDFAVDVISYIDQLLVGSELMSARRSIRQAESQASESAASGCNGSSFLFQLLLGDLSCFPAFLFRCLCCLISSRSISSESLNKIHFIIHSKQLETL